MSGVTREERARPRSRWRTAIDLSGAAVFAVSYLLTRNMTIATLALAVTSFAALLVRLALDRRIAPVPLILGVTAGLSAGLSLVFHNAGIIKGEVTVTHLLIGAVLLGGLAAGTNLLKLVLGEVVALPDDAWWRLTFRFGLFALGIAVANEIVRRTQSDAVWVFFKFPILPFLHAAFIAMQLPMIARARRQAKSAKAAECDARPGLG